MSGRLGLGAIPPGLLLQPGLRRHNLSQWAGANLLLTRRHRSLGLHYTGRKGGWRQALTVGLFVVIVTVYLTKHREILDMVVVGSTT